MPLHFAPTRGWSGPSSAWALTRDVPHSSRSATAAPPFGVTGPDRSGQAERAGIGPCHRLVDVFVRHDRDRGTELLLVDDPHPFGNVDEDRGCEEVAGSAQRLAADRCPGATLQRIIDEPDDAIELGSVVDGAELRPLVHPVADHDGAGQLGQCLDPLRPPHVRARRSA